MEEGVDNASIKQIKNGVIQSRIFYRRAVYPVPYEKCHNLTFFRPRCSSIKIDFRRLLLSPFMVHFNSVSGLFLLRNFVAWLPDYCIGGNRKRLENERQIIQLNT